MTLPAPAASALDEPGQQGLQVPEAAGAERTDAADGVAQVDDEPRQRSVVFSVHRSAGLTRSQLRPLKDPG